MAQEVRKLSIRSYNAFLKAAKARGGLSHKQAQAAYRVMRARIGRSLKGVDVKRHPRIFSESSGKARRGGGRKRPGEKPSKAPAAKPTPTKVLKRISSLAEWERSFNRFHGPFQTLIIVSSADYEDEDNG